MSTTEQTEQSSGVGLVLAGEGSSYYSNDSATIVPPSAVSCNVILLKNNSAAMANEGVVIALDTSKVTVAGKAEAIGRDSSKVSAFESAVVRAYDSCEVTTWDGATVEVLGPNVSIIVKRGFPKIKPREGSHYTLECHA